MMISIIPIYNEYLHYPPLNYYNQGQNILDFRENPWNIETTSDLLSSITSLRVEEFQRASFNIDLRPLYLSTKRLKMILQAERHSLEASH